jgi:hypothetical protein
MGQLEEKRLALGAGHASHLLGQSTRTAGRPNGYTMPRCGRVNTSALVKACYALLVPKSAALQ